MRKRYQSYIIHLGGGSTRLFFRFSLWPGHGDSCNGVSSTAVYRSAGYNERLFFKFVTRVVIEARSG